MTNSSTTGAARRTTRAVGPVAALTIFSLAWFSLAWNVPPAAAQDGWNPFGESDDSYAVKPRRNAANAPSGANERQPAATTGAPGADPYGNPGNLPPLSSGTGAIERTELAPLAPASPSLPNPAAVPNAYPAPGTGPGFGPDTGPGGGPAGQNSLPQYGNPAPIARPVDEKHVAALLAAQMVPNRSPTLTGLWYTSLYGRGTAIPASETDLAVRVEALWQSGFPVEAARLMSAYPESNTPLTSALAGKTAIGIGDSEAGCRAVKTANEKRNELPKPMVAELLLLAGYCGIINGNTKAAATVADLMREQAMGDPDEVALLTSAAAGSAPNLRAIRRLTPLGLRLALRAKATLEPATAKIATPPTLALIARETAIPAAAAIAAMEAAARLNLIPLSRLAEAYRRAGPSQAAGQPLEQGSASSSRSEDPGPSADGRPGLFAAAEREVSQFQKTRRIRAFLDNARRDGLYLQALLMSGQLVQPLQPVQEIGWFAETAIEVLIAAGNYEQARRWQAFASLQVQQSPNAFGHWLALIDLTDPTRTARRGDELQALEYLALQGSFAPEALHRLATVLDALDYNVPMRLWEAASRTPQPNGGHLPATGILKDLQDASRAREPGTTGLLTIRTLGKDGGEGAHMIALGDAIRGLRRAGLEAEARRVAFEALLAIWPRATN